MKTTLNLIIGLLLLISINVESQIKNDRPASAIYVAYQPADHGFGIRGDYYINESVGTYGSFSYGNWGLMRYVGVNHHFKATLGVLIPVKRYYTEQRFTGLAGFNYHHADIDDDVNIDYGSYSFELGLTFNIKERIRIGVRTDIIHWEPCIDVGIPLRKPTTRELVYDVCK